MTTLLDTVQINNHEIKIWYSEHIAIRSVLSLIFKGYAKLIDQKFLFPNINWEKFGGASVVWATNSDEKIIGGICFELDKSYNAGFIKLVFVEVETEYTADVNNSCLVQVKKIVKEHGMNSLMQQIHVDNQADIDIAYAGGLKPSFYLLSRSLVDDI